MSHKKSLFLRFTRVALVAGALSPCETRGQHSCQPTVIGGEGCAQTRRSAHLAGPARRQRAILLRCSDGTRIPTSIIIQKKRLRESSRADPSAIVTFAPTRGAGHAQNHFRSWKFPRHLLRRRVDGPGVRESLTIKKMGRSQRQRLRITPQKNDCELFAQRSELIKRGYGLS
jgi:hypothetical protein